MSAPNNTLSPREERLAMYRSIVSELSITECMHLKGMCIERENELTRIIPKNLEEPKRFVIWMCKRFGIQLPTKSERTDFNVTNIWICMVHNLIVQKGLKNEEIARIINRSESLVRRCKIDYEILFNIIHTDTPKAIAFRNDKREFLMALREYNNLKD